MTEREKIESLKRELNSLEKRMESCSHDFKDPVYDPETVKEPVFSHYEACGSDPNPVFNYVDRTKRRWSRECRICGKIEYTYNQEPVIKEYKPKF